MSVIIRLQGLPWSASALDIRNFFRGLIIPQGGVHIIGGEKGDAFIAFSSDEDARQGMMRNTASLNGVPVQLFLSSKSEMQSVIDEARNRDMPSVAVAPARVMPPAPSGGMGQDYQNQPYHMHHGMNNQRPPPPQQPSYPKAPDPNQGHFPGMQNVDRGHNQVPNQMHGQQKPDRPNQFGFEQRQDPVGFEQRQDPYQQNVPPSGTQKTGNEGQTPWAQGYEGFSSDRNFGKDNQQNQWNTGGYEGQDSQQWYQEGQELGTKQPYHAGNQPPQGSGQQRDHPPPNQYDPSAAGQEAHFPPQQRRDQPYNPESLWQEEHGTGNRPRPAEQPGPQDMNRRNILPRPGQGIEPTGMAHTEHMPPRPGPDEHMRFPAMARPGMEQMPGMMKDQGRGRPNEGFPPRAMEEQRFPPGRREGPPVRGGPQQGAFSEGPPKHGILPTPDMANPEQQRDFNSEQFYDPEEAEPMPWPGPNGEESHDYELGRGPGQFPAGREPGQFPAGREPGQFPAGREPGQFPTGREPGQFPAGREPGQFPAGREPEKSRPRDRPRRSRFDQVDERPIERGPDGRPLERGFGGRPGDTYHEERSMERGSDRRPLPEREHGFDGRPSRRGHDGPPPERGHDEWPGPDRRNQSRPSADREGMPFDRNENRQPLERGPERRPFKRGPDGMPKEGGLLGRGPDMRPLPGGPEEVAGVEHEGSVDRPEPGRRFEGPRGRFDGPPGNRFPPNEEYDPTGMELNPEGHGGPGMRGPPGRGFRGGRDFDDQGRERGDRTGRGRDRRDEGPRGARGDDRGRGRGRRPFDQHEGRFDEYPQRERYEDGRHEEMHRDPFTRGGDVEPGLRHPGRPMRGRGRPDDDRDMDRRHMGRGREDMDRDRHRKFHAEETRTAGKGLLGDAPGGLLPTPPALRPPEDSHNKVDDFQRDRDRDRRGHWNREDRDTARDERPSRGSDHRQPRDRSPSREHGHRRSERDRDRSEHRDRSSNRDSKDTGPKGSEKSGKNDKKSDQQTKEMPASNYIHAKGFPAAYTSKEIQRFFFGCDLLFTGIKILKNVRGQSTGEVFLEFPTEDHAKKAITKNGETIFGTAITMTFTTKKDFDEKTKSSPPSTEKEKAPSKPSPQTDEKGTRIVKIKGLPPNIKREDLVNFFSSVKLASGGKPVIIEYDDKKQATGIAYIMAASLKDFETAMGYNGHILGSKALQLSAGEQKEMDASIAKQGEIGSKVEKPNIQLEKPAPGPGVMGARPPLMGVAPPGRPPLLSQKPSVNMSPDAPRNGPATLEPNMNLPRPPPGERPPRDLGPLDRPPRDWGPMERSPRELGPVDRPPRDWGPAERPPKDWGPAERPPRGWGPGDRPPRDERPGERPPKNWGPGFCVQIQGLPMLATYNEIRDFFTGLNIAYHRGVQIVHDANSKPTGEAFVEFVGQEDKDEALKKDKTSLGRQIVAVKSVVKSDMIERLRKARLSSVAPAADPPSSPHFPPKRPEAPFMTIPPRLLNPRWFYMSCQNFPQGITVPEILDFFQDYTPVPQSIRQLYNDDGTSSGNAVVGFFSREDAELALEEMNGALVGQSMVVLQPIKSRG